MSSYTDCYKTDKPKEPNGAKGDHQSLLSNRQDGDSDSRDLTQDDDKLAEKTTSLNSDTSHNSLHHPNKFVRYALKSINFLIYAATSQIIHMIVKRAVTLNLPPDASFADDIPRVLLATLDASFQWPTMFLGFLLTLFQLASEVVVNRFLGRHHVQQHSVESSADRTSVTIRQKPNRTSRQTLALVGIAIFMYAGPYLATRYIPRPWPGFFLPSG
ncbi:hypothetical protein NM208_g1702 [Fusarium decemcellulare]|uniref:Uncharacterized protein n=1 Tax=Fusarium decemcellulare TaxID=57161 RepID=A0ACC1SV29_9HYPO|nr:hypothetical protein NM208_g1702 [Fusarium decemcellulare]